MLLDGVTRWSAGESGGNREGLMMTYNNHCNTVLASVSLKQLRGGAGVVATPESRTGRKVMRCALEKAGEAAARYTIEVSKEMKAFDGPPLGPRDVRELLLRVFRVKLSVPEAIALVAYFTKVMGCGYSTGAKRTDRRGC